MGKREELQERFDNQLESAKTELFEVVETLSLKIEETDKNVQGNCQNMNRLNRLIESALNRVEKITETTAQKTANNVLAKIGLDDPDAAHEIRMIREHHRARKRFFRETVSIAWTVVVRSIIVAFLGFLAFQQYLGNVKI